jgi:hypothetical protein
MAIITFHRFIRMPHDKDGHLGVMAGIHRNRGDTVLGDHWRNGRVLQLSQDTQDFRDRVGESPAALGNDTQCANR